MNLRDRIAYSNMMKKGREKKTVRMGYNNRVRSRLVYFVGTT